MNRKIKPDFRITGLLPGVFSFIVFILTFLLTSPTIAFYTLGGIISGYALLMLYSYYRTKHSNSLVSTAYMLSMALFLITSAPFIKLGKKVDFPTESKIFIFTSVFLLLWLLYLNFTRKLKWRGREILELAALNVDDLKSSYTERPLPVGKSEYTKSQLLSFASFFEKNLLGLTYKEANRIVFMPLKYGNEFSAVYNPAYNYKTKTWIAFNYNGNVSVHMSKEDYLDFKDDLAFDKLCNSLNNLIIEFLELFLDGNNSRIIDKLDNLRINVFT